MEPATPNPGQTQEGRKSRYVRQTWSNRIQVPKHMIVWKLPVVYEVVSVSRNQNEVIIRLRIISEGE